MKLALGNRMKAAGSRSLIQSFIIMLVLLAIAVALSRGVFVQPNNLANLVKQNAILAFIALAQMVIILTGGIDLSVGAVTAIASVMVVLFQGYGIGFALLMAMLTGIAIGVANGLIVTYVKLPSFAVTLATMQIVYSIAKVMTNGAKIEHSINDAMIAPWFNQFYNGSFLGLPNTLPAYQTACGIVDIMLHTLERYFTSVENVMLTDYLCEGLLKTMVVMSRRVMETPEDYNVRAEIMWAGSLSHNDVMGTGRIGDFSSHAIEHELGARYDIAHGAGLAAIFPAWMKYVYTHNLKRFTQFAVRVMNCEMDFECPENTALEGIARLEQLFKDIGMPTRLSELGIDDDRWNEMALACAHNDMHTVGDLHKLDSKAIMKIFELCK